MPDVNLLRDTKQPEEPKKVDPTPPTFDVTDPAAEAKPGIGGFFRNLLKRKSPQSGPELGVATRPASSSGSMSLGRTGSNERILSETKKSGRTGVIPLPEEDGAYNVNLLTEDLVTTFDPRRKMIQLGMVAIGSVIIVAAAYFGLQIYGKSITKQVTTSKTELASVESQIAALSPDQTAMNDASKKLGAIQALIDRHVRWTRFFTQLEHYTLPTVTYGTNFNGDITGSWNLTATTSSFDEVAKQYLVFQQAVTNNDFISTFTINGATLAKSNSGDRVSFTVSFTILPSLLENPAEKVAAATPDTNTSTNTTVQNTNIGTIPTTSHDDQRGADLAEIRLKLNLYNIGNHTYPPDLQTLAVYLPQVPLPTDPTTKQNYGYVLCGSTGYILYAQLEQSSKYLYATPTTGSSEGKTTSSAPTCSLLTTSQTNSNIATQ